MGVGESDPPDPKVIFETEVAEVRSAVKAVLDAETARAGELRYTDHGVSTDGESWNATVWRSPDDSNLVLLKCKRGSRDGWHVVIEPTSDKHPRFVIHWPDPTFEVMLKAGIRTLRI